MEHIVDEIHSQDPVLINRFIVTIDQEIDIVTARSFSRNKAQEMGFSLVDQTRIATAVSEIARNIYLYAKPGTIECNEVYREGRAGLHFRAEDSGPGISNVELVMQFGITTSNGLGAGLPGVKQLMDEFSICSCHEGTQIEFTKWIN